MTKKVLVLSASSANTETRTCFATGLFRRAGSGNEVEKNLCQRYALAHCRGCGVCNRTHKCVQKRRYGRRIGQDGCG